MSVPYLLWIHLYALSSPITMAQRCASLEPSKVVGWIEAERSRANDYSNLEPPQRRQKSWLPDIKLSAGIVLDDGQQYRILDGSSTAGLRTSALNEGGERTEYELNLKWFLSTHNSGGDRLAWQKFIEHTRRQRGALLSRLIRTLGRWFKTVQQRCDNMPDAGLDASLLTLELELQQLSEGRFYPWLKEKK